MLEVLTERVKIDEETKVDVTLLTAEAGLPEQEVELVITNA